MILTSKGLEQYRLVEKMGDGAFSNVYKAVDRKTGQKVAVKVVRKYELNSTQVRNRFVSPVHLSFHLRHLPCPGQVWGQDGGLALSFRFYLCFQA